MSKQNIFKQIFGVTRMDFKSIPMLAGTSLVIVIGMAGVVGVLLAVLAISDGVLHAFVDGDRDDRAILRKGSNFRWQRHSY